MNILGTKDSIVTIYKDPNEQTEIEGKAKLIEFLGDFSSDVDESTGVGGQIESWLVEFENNPGVKCKRKILFPIPSH